MTRGKTIFLLIVFGIIVGGVTSMALLPKHYTVRDGLTGAMVFWQDKEAFIFLDINTTGHGTNAFRDTLQSHSYGISTFLFRPDFFFENHVVAYRLLPSGEILSTPLPSNAAGFGRWTLEDGALQFTPTASNRAGSVGFRWDGTQFVTVPAGGATRQLVGTSSTLKPDDLSDDDDDSGLLTATARREFKAANWHYKVLYAYETGQNEATLPINLGKTSFNCTVTSFPLPTGKYDTSMLAIGLKNLTIVSAGQSSRAQVLWSAKGPQPISKSEFELRSQNNPRALRAPGLIFVWVAILLLGIAWKIGAWAHLFWSLFGTKRRILKSMGTSYSFPPANPSQFPLLDTPALDRYTQEFERMGFVRLLDFSLVSNAPNPAPNFCRAFVHTRHHCFGEIHQAFPRGKAPLLLRCSIQSLLEGGWSLSFTDRKPMAAGALLRRKKALVVGMPQAEPTELLNSFLQMRAQICNDLGISPLRDDTLDAYMAKNQQSLQNMREAVKQKNVATGLSQVYFRKLSLLRTQPEYTWLGDYPKEAEKRRQGFGIGSHSAESGLG